MTDTVGGYGERRWGSEAQTEGASRVSDADLCAGVGRHDHDAFAEIYTRHRSFVRARARRMCGDRFADEVVQEVFLRLWNEPERFDPSRGTLQTYLGVQARGRAIDMVRREAARQARESADHSRSVTPDVDVATQAVRMHTAGKTRQALAGLPERERAAIVLAFFGGYTYHQVASLLGEPEGTIKGRIRSGLRRLGHDLLTRSFD